MEESKRIKLGASISFEMCGIFTDQVYDQIRPLDLKLRSAENLMELFLSLVFCMILCFEAN